MSDKRLDFIKQFCDTAGTRLKSGEKNLLVQILSNPEKYNGFESREIIQKVHWRDFRDTYVTETRDQYRVVVDKVLKVLHRTYEATDGEVFIDNWDWARAIEITNLRQIIGILYKIIRD